MKVLCGTLLQVACDRTKITLGRCSAGRAKKKKSPQNSLFQIWIMQIGFTREGMNSVTAVGTNMTKLSIF